MLKYVLLVLTLSGLQAVPLSVPGSFQKTSSASRLPNGFQQGTEPSGNHEPGAYNFQQGTEPTRRFLVDLNTGLVQEHISEMKKRVEFIHSSLGNGEMERRHWLTDEVPIDAPVEKNGGGWVRVEEPSAPHFPDGFRQGTEPVMSLPDGFRQGTEPMMSLPDGFRQGTEPVMSLPDGFRQGTEPMMSLPDGFRQGTEPVMSLPDGFRREIEPVMSLPDGLRQGTKPVMSLPDGFRQGTEPVMSLPDGFRQGTEPMMSLPDGFRQGTEPVMSLPDGFRQGTEPMMSLPDGFRQGTEPVMSLPDGFRREIEPVMSLPDGLRQGTKPVMSLPDGFRQGTEPVMSLPDGFRQGTEPVMSLPDGFRQGTEPMMSLPDGFRQGTEPVYKVPDGFRQGTEPVSKVPGGLRQRTEPSIPMVHPQTVVCKGDVISGKCYEFNPTALAFQDAQASCRALAPNAELVSVTSGDLHSRLVSLATKGGESNPVLTWLGGMVKNQQASWVDGSEWNYSDWMPGHPNIQTEKPVCVEMFRIDESWWTAADCDLKRASICSYPISA